MAGRASGSIRLTKKSRTVERFCSVCSCLKTQNVIHFTSSINYSLRASARSAPGKMPGHVREALARACASASFLLWHSETRARCPCLTLFIDRLNGDAGGESYSLAPRASYRDVAVAHRSRRTNEPRRVEPRRVLRVAVVIPAASAERITGKVCVLSENEKSRPVSPRRPDEIVALRYRHFAKRPCFFAVLPICHFAKRHYPPILRTALAVSARQPTLFGANHRDELPIAVSLLSPRPTPPFTHHHQSPGWGLIGCGARSARKSASVGRLICRKPFEINTLCPRHQRLSSPRRLQIAAQKGLIAPRIGDRWPPPKSRQEKGTPPPWQRLGFGWWVMKKQLPCNCFAHCRGTRKTEIQTRAILATN